MAEEKTWGSEGESQFNCLPLTLTQTSTYPRRFGSLEPPFVLFNVAMCEMGIVLDTQTTVTVCASDSPSTPTHSRHSPFSATRS